MSDMEIDAMVVTALDEVAWLLNLRGNDIPYTPVFRAYAVLDANKLILYLPPEKQTVTVKQHLKSEVSNVFSALYRARQETCALVFPGLYRWQ